MSVDHNSLNKIGIIVFLFMLAAAAFPFFGFFLGAHIENTYYEPRWAAGTFTATTLISLVCLVQAHSLARTHWNFIVLKYFTYPYFALCILTLGWVSNNAWYEYDTFSDFVYPSYSVRQDAEFPNHFLFKGPIDLGAANLLTQTILGAKGVDPNSELVLELHSDGGSPQVGILMAEFIKQYDVKVEVMGHCASACTMALLGSSKRYIHPRAWIGFHSAYVESEENED